jgi:murein L,D-transpeptidase YafK
MNSARDNRPFDFAFFILIILSLALADCVSEGQADSARKHQPNIKQRLSKSIKILLERPSDPRPPLAEKADRILILKSERLLILYKGDKLLRKYIVALGGDPVRPKQCEGDQRTPEGLYRIGGRNPGSAYHYSLRISYPNENDRAAAEKLGCPPGGDIMIHGLPAHWDKVGAAHAVTDWTRGCVAVTNPEIDEIAEAVDDGTPIEIRP